MGFFVPIGLALGATAETAALTGAVATLGATGAAVGGASALSAGAAKAKAANYSAQVAQNNATISEQQAQYALSTGETQAGNQSRKGASQQARVKVAQAANNLDINSGSAVKVQEGEAEINRLDTLSVMNNAALKAYGYRNQGANFTAQAGLDTAEADQAITGSALKAAGGLLGNASSIFSSSSLAKSLQSSAVPDDFDPLI